MIVITSVQSRGFRVSFGSRASIASSITATAGTATVATDTTTTAATTTIFMMIKLTALACIIIYITLSFGWRASMVMAWCTTPLWHIKNKLSTTACICDVNDCISEPTSAGNRTSTTHSLRAIEGCNVAERFAFYSGLMPLLGLSPCGVQSFLHKLPLLGALPTRESLPKLYPDYEAFNLLNLSSF